MVRAILIPLIPILAVAFVVFLAVRNNGSDGLASKRQLAKRLAMSQQTLMGIEQAINHDADIHGRLPIHSTVLDHIRKHNIDMHKEIAK